MTGYISVTRTNSFHVKNADLFKKIVSQISEPMATFKEKAEDGSTVYGFCGNGQIAGFKGDEYNERRVYNVFKDHVIVPGEAIVIEAVGAEGLSYLSAYAVIITAEKIESIDLNEEIEKRLSIANAVV